MTRLKDKTVPALAAIILTLLSACSTPEKQKTASAAEQPGSFFDQTGGKAALPQTDKKD